MSDSLLDGYLHRRCGGRYARAEETMVVRVSGMSSQVVRHFFRCDKCGDERRTVEQRERAEQTAVAAMREEHQLLTAREIRQLRDSLGLTHQQLGDLLYGIPKGIVEGWEKGRYVQNPQVDALLRTFTDREALEQRAAKSGVVLPVPEGAAGTAGETPAGEPVEVLDGTEPAGESEAASELEPESARSGA